MATSGVPYYWQIDQVSIAQARYPLWQRTRFVPLGTHPHYSGTCRRRREVKPTLPPQKQPAATSNELAKLRLPAPTRQWSTPGWVPDVDCSCGYGSVDGRARLLWGRATHDKP